MRGTPMRAFYSDDLIELAMGGYYDHLSDGKITNKKEIKEIDVLFVKSGKRVEYREGEYVGKKNNKYFRTEYLPLMIIHTVNGTFYANYESIREMIEIHTNEMVGPLEVVVRGDGPENWLVLAVDQYPE